MPASTRTTPSPARPLPTATTTRTPTSARSRRTYSGGGMPSGRRSTPPTSWRKAQRKTHDQSFLEPQRQWESAWGGRRDLGGLAVCYSGQLSKKQFLGVALVDGLLLEVVVAGEEGVLLVEHVLELVVEVVLYAATLLLVELLILDLHGVPVVVLLRLLFLHVRHHVHPLHAVLLPREEVRQIVEVVDDLQLLGVLLVLVQLGVLLQVFEVGSEDSDPVEEMSFEVEVVLLSQSELVVVVVETLLGQSHNFGGLLQTDFLEIVLAHVDFSPFFDYFDDFEDHPLLTAFLLHGGGLRLHLQLFLRPDRTGAAHRGQVLGQVYFEQNDVAGVVHHEGVGHLAHLRADHGVLLLREVVSFQCFG